MALQSSLRATVDRDAWSGEGDLTVALVERLAAIEQVGFLRVEDAPVSRAGGGFNFICNEIYVGFRIRRMLRVRRMLGVLPLPTIAHAPSLSLVDLEPMLSVAPEIGPADYADASMLQYLRSERVPAAYQARGPKLVEMVRIYAIGAGLRP